MLKIILPSFPYLLSGRAYVFLSNGTCGTVGYEIMPTTDTGISVGAVAAEQDLIDQMVADKHVILNIGPDQAVTIDLDGPCAHAGKATFSCLDPLYDASDENAPAENIH